MTSDARNDDFLRKHADLVRRVRHLETSPPRLAWEDAKAVELGVNDALIHVTWTSHSIFGIPTTEFGTLENGTTPGWWDTTGTAMRCFLEGSWRITANGIVTHKGATCPVSVALQTGATDQVSMFSVNMADLDSHALDFTTTQFMAVDDFAQLNVAHVTADDNVESTLTGTLVFELA